jgi:Cysteine rich repeat
MNLKSLSLACIFLSALTTSALAQQSGTDEEQKACTPDVKKFCGAVISQGDLAILSCLQQNRPKISKACNQVLVNHGQ